MSDSSENLTLKQLRLEKRLIALMLKEAEVLYKRAEYTEQRQEDSLKQLEKEIEEIKKASWDITSTQWNLEKVGKEFLQAVGDSIVQLNQNAERDKLEMKNRMAECLQMVDDSACRLRDLEESIRRPWWYFSDTISLLIALAISLTLNLAGMFGVLQEKAQAPVEREHVAIPLPGTSEKSFLGQPRIQIEEDKEEPEEPMASTPEPVITHSDSVISIAPESVPESSEKTEKISE